MLFVLNKEKLCAYFVSVLTVVILFCATVTLKDKSENTVSTSTNISLNNSTNSTNSTNSARNNSTNSINS